MDDESVLRIYEKHGGDLDAIAAELDVNLDDVDPSFPVFPIYIPEIRTRPKELGRVSMRRHLVSTRHAHERGWPKVDREKIEKAQKDYDAGLIEMCQGKDGPWTLLYAIRRKRRAKPRTYFTAERLIG